MRDFAHNADTPQKAVIYCRVSTTGQDAEGNGLDSQEYRCRQHAEAKGYEVEAVFPDDVSGGGDFMKRKGMVALLAYLDAMPHENYVVIFDDLKRYARDTEFHLSLRREMMARNATRECLNFRFEDTPEGEFNETIAAAANTLERKQNRRQVIQKMRARVEKGYYCFAPVFGYTYKKLEGGGKVLTPNKDAPLIKEALQGFASGRFQTATEVKRFLEGQPSFPKNTAGVVHIQSVFNILNCPLYAGYITIEKWGVHLHKGKHEPLIHFATWQKIQDRLKGNANTPARKDFSEDFPLRGFVTCGCCGHPLTAAWAKGRNALYAYYFCQSKPCPEYRKSIRKEKIEGDFETLLRDLQPAPHVFQIVRAMFKTCWESFRLDAAQRASKAKAERLKLEKKVDKLMERLVSADSETLVTAYEKQIKKLEVQKTRLAEDAASGGKPLAGFENVYRTACAFLANPYKLWLSPVLDHKRVVQRLLFPGRVAYCRNEGYRTAEIAEPIRLLGAFAASDSKVVERVGFEPTYAEAGRFTVCWI